MGNHRGYEIAKLIKKYNCQRIAEIGVEAGRCLKKVLQYEEVRKIVTEYWGIDPYMPLPHYLKIKAQRPGLKAFRFFSPAPQVQAGERPDHRG